MEDTLEALIKALNRMGTPLDSLDLSGKLKIQDSKIQEAISMCTVVVVFHIEWCIRMPLSTSVTSFTTNSIAHNYHTDTLNINI
jgi:hypothetical protein